MSDDDTFLDKYNALYNENKELLRIIEIRKSKVTNELLGEVNVSVSIVNLNENEKYIRISQVSEIMNHIKIYPILDENYNNIIELNINKSILNEYNFGENIFENDKIIKNNESIKNYTNQNIKIGENILSNELIISDYYIDTNGGEESYKGWSTTDYLNLENYKRILITNNNNEFNAIYDKDKKFIKTLNFLNCNLYNSKIGYVGAEIAYIKVTDIFKYIRLSNNTNKLKNVKIYPISNDDFNKHLIFNIDN